MDYVALCDAGFLRPPTRWITGQSWRRFGGQRHHRPHGLGAVFPGGVAVIRAATSDDIGALVAMARRFHRIAQYSEWACSTAGLRRHAAGDAGR